MHKYIYNKSTGTLHIEGLCHHAQVSPNNENYKVFSAEDETLAYDGRAVRMCKMCQHKRESLLRTQNY